MRGQVHLPTPLTIAWVSNLPELQNSYLDSPAPLTWGVCCGNKSGLHDWGSGGWEGQGMLLGVLSSLSHRAGP